MGYGFHMQRKLNLFRARPNTPFSRKIKAQIWFGVQIISNASQSSRIRVAMLRIFGAQIGTNVIIRNRSRIHFPWNLEIGDDCWIGDGVWFINHERITLGSNICISQRTIICSGGHDYRSASLEYAHKPVLIKSGAWVCLDAKVLPGVTIGECSVVSAGEVARKSVPDYSMLVGGEIRQIDPPK
jgi:putative colanic acid biosynthesis acetyltransferase WcaF